jgi:hypothetical protein
MSNIDPERPPDAVFHSEKLLGLRSECPLCSAGEISTGWLLYHDDAHSCWYLDLKCIGCGCRGATWRQEWLPLINEVLEAKAKQGFDIAATVRAGRNQRGGQGKPVV